MNNLNLLIIQNKIQDSILTLSITILLVLISQIYKKSLFASILLFISLLSLVNLLPIYRDNSLVQMVRGGVSDVSITSGIVLLLVAVRLVSHRSLHGILSLYEQLTILLVGALLYISALGFIKFDIYNLGYLYNIPELVIFFGLILLMLMQRGRLGYIWLIVFIAYYFKLLESHNLWDYLFDPILWIAILLNLFFKLRYYIKGAFR